MLNTTFAIGQFVFHFPHNLNFKIKNKRFESHKGLDHILK